MTLDLASLESAKSALDRALSIKRHVPHWQALPDLVREAVTAGIIQ